MREIGDNNRTIDASVAQHAYTCLRELIVNLDIPPGSTIHEQTLQDRLGVGRTPLREALHRLSHEHMIHIYPRRAIVVATLGVTEIRQIFEMRVITESAAAGLTAERINDEQLKYLIELGQGLHNNRLKADANAFLKADQQFHRLLASYAQNAILDESIDRLQTLNLWLWNMYFKSHHPHSSDLFAHDPIIEAISIYDVEAATNAMRSHVLSSKEQLLSAL